MKIRKVARKLMRKHGLRTAPLICGVVIFFGMSAYAMTISHSIQTLKPVATRSKPQGQTVQVLKHTDVSAKPSATKVATPSPAPTVAPTPSVPTAPATVPVPKAANDVTQSPTAVASANTTPGSGVSGLSSTGSSPSAPADSSTSSSTSSTSQIPCTNTPGDYASSNWAGYFVNNCSFTAVSGKWTVPTPTTTSTTDVTADTAWIGIGGVDTNDLIQAGTEETVDTDGTINVAIFYELLPDTPHFPTSITVSPGNHISASINETSAGTWLINVSNTSTGQSYSKTVAYTSSHTSAEWIEEDPSYSDGTLVPFDDFGSVSFTNASATGNGTQVTLSDASKVKLVDSRNRSLATPSVISGANNDGFTVVRQHP
jgi:hypothetical protein